MSIKLKHLEKDTAYYVVALGNGKTEKRTSKNAPVNVNLSFVCQKEKDYYDLLDALKPLGCFDDSGYTYSDYACEYSYDDLDIENDNNEKDNEEEHNSIWIDL